MLQELKLPSPVGGNFFSGKGLLFKRQKLMHLFLLALHSLNLPGWLKFPAHF